MRCLIYKVAPSNHKQISSLEVLRPRFWQIARGCLRKQSSRNCAKKRSKKNREASGSSQKHANTTHQIFIKSIEILIFLGSQMIQGWLNITTRMTFHLQGIIAAQRLRVLDSGHINLHPNLQFWQDLFSETQTRLILGEPIQKKEISSCQKYYLNKMEETMRSQISLIQRIMEDKRKVLIES